MMQNKLSLLKRKQNTSALSNKIHYEAADDSFVLNQ